MTKEPTIIDYFAARETLSDLDDMQGLPDWWKALDLAANGPLPDGQTWSSHPIEMFRRDAAVRASVKFIRAVAMVQASQSAHAVNKSTVTPVDKYIAEATEAKSNRVHAIPPDRFDFFKGLNKEIDRRMTETEGRPLFPGLPDGDLYRRAVDVLALLFSRLKI